MASNAKTIAELLNGDVTVTATDIANDAVTADKIATGAVVADGLGAGAVTATKLGAGAVTNAKLAGSITSDKISSVSGASLIANTIAVNTVSGNVIVANTVSNSAFATGTIENYMRANTLDFGMRNRIINGAMRIDQRNAGASATPSNGQYSLDRWQQQMSASAKFSVQQDSSANTVAGFTNSYYK